MALAHGQVAGSVRRRRPRRAAGPQHARPGAELWPLLGEVAVEGARLVRDPARPAAGRIARGGTGAVAAAGMVLGSWLFPPAAGAQIAGDGLPRGGGPRAAVEWAGFAGNAQHTTVARKQPQPLRRIRWRAKADLAPVLVDGTLPIHYGSPMITAANTVLVPTRVSAKAGFGLA